MHLERKELKRMNDCSESISDSSCGLLNQADCREKPPDAEKEMIRAETKTKSQNEPAWDS